MHAHVIAHDTKRRNKIKCNRTIGVCALTFIAIGMCVLFTISGVSQTPISSQRHLLTSSTMPKFGSVIKFETSAEKGVGQQMTELEFDDVIGEGSFAVVHKGRIQVQQADTSEYTDHICAIKVFKHNAASVQSQIMREAQFMREVHNLLPNNSLKLYAGPFVHDNRWYVLEELGGDSLLDVLYSESKRDAARDAKSVACEILLQGGNALHRLNDVGRLVHRDIKLANLLTGNGETEQIKVIDFGMMQQLKADDNVILGFGGSPSTMSSLMYWLHPNAPFPVGVRDKIKVEISAFVQRHPSVIDMPSLVMSVMEFLVMAKVKAGGSFDRLFNPQTEQRSITARDVNLSSNKGRLLETIQEHYGKGFRDFFNHFYPPFISPSANGYQLKMVIRQHETFTDWETFISRAEQICNKDGDAATAE